MRRQCVFFGCTKNAKARRLCGHHYDHVKRSDMPLPPRVTLKDRLIENAVLNPANDCWEWQGYRNEWGYGISSLKSRVIGAHRLSAHVFLGFDLSSDLLVCHKCDNPPCINPAHLFIGTDADNMADMIRKGRKNPAVGERNRHAKLSGDQVRRIRELNQSGTSRNTLAAEFGVSYAQVSKIIRGESWGDHACLNDLAA